MTTGAPEQPPAPLVLHILPLDLARGAQAHARLLCDALDGPTQRHRSITLFASESGALRPDSSLGVAPSQLRALGFHPLAFWRLRRQVRGMNPAVVVAHGSEPLKYASLATPSRIPLVYHRVGLSGPQLRNPIRRFLHRSTIHRANAVVAVSAEVLEDLHRIHPERPEREVIIPNARDIIAFSPPTTRHGNGTTPRLLYVGHLAESKRPALFLEAVERLVGEGHDIRGVMVGDGPLLESLRPKAEAIGVQMLGRRHDVARLMAEGDILVFTSGPNSEGLPGVLIEAGLAGLPVVSTEAPGVRTVVVDGQTGFVVGSDDLDGMIWKLGLLISDRLLRAKMGSAAREHCVAAFAIESGAERWRELIDELISVTSTSRG